ncbi:hypothetical protein CPB83DRAFT_859099 [Crepidotus variabilis]|uniref:PH domain-containing protein n=1 Tax=Crepidotus variabilis TaxID=179855 RepID=A0A9P6JLZ6_9AGAR|nr:hypothetical protein CPB83DRAFT_859099 [Crepidotus variabilis]
MTSYPQAASGATPWVANNGYVPPPRFQQLRAQELAGNNPNPSIPLNQPLQPQQPPLDVAQGLAADSRAQPPQMSHTRVHQRSMSVAANGVPGQAPGQPHPQNIPPGGQSFSGSGPPNFNQNQAPLLATPPPQSQPRPQPQSQQGSPKMGQRASPSHSQQSSTSQPPTAPALHPEIRSVVQLTIALAHKVYFSGPLVRRYERLPDGSKPHKDDGWTEVWAQLGGTTMSIWDMKEIQEASKQGKEVPPSYINVTDAFFQVLGSVTVPATATTPAKRYSNVLTLNNAGSNLYLFSCPTTPALLSWAAALRLASWEKSRLEEIYTAHLIRITLSARDVPTTLVRGRMEGWARVRIAGQTDWKRVWLSVQAGADLAAEPRRSHESPSGHHNTIKKNRVSALFSREPNSPGGAPLPAKPMVFMFSSPKPKDRKKPLVTLANLSQAFGVYPERPELISKSTLIKLEGTFGDEEMCGSLRTREGWALVMPELEASIGQAAEMLKWVVALHDSFELYGRPEAWTWDPRDPNSLMFGYPVGPQKESLFLERDVVEKMDPREERTSAIRSEMKKLLVQHMHPAVQVVQNRVPAQPTGDGPPMLPPIGAFNSRNDELPPLPPQGGPSSSGFQLPPLSFGPSTSSSSTTNTRQRPLTPITERSVDHARGQSTDRPIGLAASTSTGPSQNGSYGAAPQSPLGAQQPQATPSQSEPEPPSLLGGPISNSPPPTLPAKPASAPSPQPGAFEMSTVSSPKPPSVSSPLASPSHQKNSSVSSPSTASPKVQANSPWNRSGPSSPLGSNSPNIPVSAAATPSPPLSYTSLSAKAASPTPGQASPTFLTNGARTTSQVTQVTSVSNTTSTSPVVSDAGSPMALNGFAPITASSHQQPPVVNAVQPSSTPQQDEFSSEANAALFYMQQNEAKYQVPHTQPFVPPPPPPPPPPPSMHQGSYDTDRSSPNLSIAAPASVYSSNPYAGISGSVDSHIPFRHGTPGTPMSFQEQLNATPSANTVDRLSPTRSGLGRKPSGARAQTSTRVYKPEKISAPTLTEAQENMDSHQDYHGPTDTYDDAEVALSYLSLADPENPTSPPLPVGPSNVANQELPQGVLNVQPLNIHAPQPTNPSNPAERDSVPYKSSFAPSNKAAERKAKAQAQKDAHLAATHKPGRANGKRKSRIGGAWESSEEEEEEEEDEDEDVDSDGEVQNKGKGPQSNSSHQTLSSNGQQGRLVPMPSDALQDMTPPGSHLRPQRNLPQIPAGQRPGDDFQGGPRRTGSDQFTDAARRTYYDDGPQIRTQAEAPMPGAARQTMWSQVLDPGRPLNGPPGGQPTRETFVQLEPSETMTKAFTPQGLLSAGLHDKEERSARRQEELARETGGSLVNVPNKPPPPQTGLLGAVTAHERERKRDGGLGATLTEREREKRVAEERQRRFDDHHRQQLDQMQQGGSMYGGQFGYNPMMNPMMMGMMGMNPMMTGGGGMLPGGGGMMPGGGGMSPMITGGGMTPMNPMMSGFPGMMGGFNPQHMFAAQQAAQAYQQAMMAFSVAGSQVGGEASNGGSPPSQAPSNNMGANMGAMSPAMTGSMAGFDPRMSMFGMPMMGMGMGMPPMGGPMGSQMGSQIGGQMTPLGPQTTGMSNFDARASPGNHSPVNMNETLQPPNASQFSSRTNSPARRGSPLAAPSAETMDRGRPPHTVSPKGS